MIPEPTCKACVLSGAGRGAISLLRVWGPGALLIADRAFRTNRPPSLGRSPRNRPRLGRIGLGVGDEAVGIVLDGPEPEVEIHGHGGRAARSLAMEAMVAAGAIEATPMEWAERTTIDRIEAEALIDLAEGPTIRTAEILLDQAAGALRRELVAIVSAIGDDTLDAIRRIDALLENSRVGLRLKSGWEVAICGRPNVGKSRLLNAIAGYDRAIVSPTPGTTRDVISIRSAIDGWPVALSDTAGFRSPSDEIEAEGIEKAIRASHQASLVLLVLDRSLPLDGEDLYLVSDRPNSIRVANKCDLPGAWPAADFGAIEVSAATGEGLSDLLGAVSKRIAPRVPSGGIGVPFRPWHVELLHAARRSLDQGRSAEAIGEIRRIIEGSSTDMPP